jgi:hypothetical protein
MFVASIILVIVAGVGAIGYVGWRSDPKQRFRKTLRQIRALPEHVRKERV